MGRRVEIERPFPDEPVQISHAESVPLAATHRAGVRSNASCRIERHLLVNRSRRCNALPLCRRRKTFAARLAVLLRLEPRDANSRASCVLADDGLEFAARHRHAVQRERRYLSRLTVDRDVGSGRDFHHSSRRSHGDQRKECSSQHRSCLEVRYSACFAAPPIPLIAAKTFAFAFPSTRIMPSAPLWNARKIEWSTRTSSPGFSTPNSTTAAPPDGMSDV